MTAQRLGCEKQLLPRLAAGRGASDAPHWRSSGGGDAAGERNMNNNVFIFNIHGYKKFSLDAEYKYFTSFLSFTSLHDIKRFLHLK